MNKIKKLFKHDKEDSAAAHGATVGNSQEGPYFTSAAATKPASAGTSTAPSTGTAHQSSVTGTTHQSSAVTEKANGVEMTTSLGDIVIALYADECPRTCKNFATLADQGYYDGIIFHRIIPGFMIQGGDPTGSGMGGKSIYGEKFEDEFVSSLKHTGKGTLSMANSGPNTNGSQFFITLGPTPHLNGKHTVFGQVVSGMDVVDALGSVRTDSGDRPLEEVKIIKARSFSA